MRLVARIESIPRLEKSSPSETSPTSRPTSAATSQRSHEETPSSVSRSLPADVFSVSPNNTAYPRPNDAGRRAPTLGNKTTIAESVYQSTTHGRQPLHPTLCTERAARWHDTMDPQERKSSTFTLGHADKFGTLSSARFIPVRAAGPWPGRGTPLRAVMRNCEVRVSTLLRSETQRCPPLYTPAGTPCSRLRVQVVLRHVPPARRRPRPRSASVPAERAASVPSSAASAGTQRRRAAQHRQPRAW